MSNSPLPDQAAAKPFDLVVLDLDGTILDLYRHLPISPIVQESIRAVQAAGIPVTIATGRTLDYVRQHIAHLNITTPVVTTQGAVIGDPRTGAILHEATIPLPLARRAVAWIDDHTYITALYFNDDDGHIQIMQNRAGAETDFYDHIFGHPRTLQPHFVSLLEEEDARLPLKFIVLEDERTTGVDLVAELTQHFSPDLTITRTHPRLVEGTAHGIDKGEGVRRLCDMLDIDPQRALAVGDSDNDIPMLQAVGCGVAMGNATPGLQAVARYSAPTLAADGAAVALQELVLAQRNI